MNNWKKTVNKLKLKQPRSKICLRNWDRIQRNKIKAWDRHHLSIHKIPPLHVLGLISSSKPSYED
jgi:hypothetical protein